VVGAPEATASSTASDRHRAARAILGKLVRFRHTPDSGPGYHVLTVDADGRVELETLGGYFAPESFVVIPE
jgi:hypothetical protein